MCTKDYHNFKKILYSVLILLLTVFAYTTDETNSSKMENQEEEKYIYITDPDIKNTIDSFFQFEQTLEGSIIVGKMTFRARRGPLFWAQIKSGKEGKIGSIFDDFSNNLETSVGMTIVKWKLKPTHFGLIKLVKDIYFKKYQKKERFKKLKSYKFLKFKDMDKKDREDKVLINNLFDEHKDIQKAANKYLEIKRFPEEDHKEIYAKFNKHIKNILDLENQPVIISMEAGSKYTVLNYFDISNLDNIEEKKDKRWDWFTTLSFGRYLNNKTLLGLSATYRSSWKPIDSDEPIPSELLIPRNWLSKITYLEPLRRNDEVTINFNVKMYTKKAMNLMPGVKITLKTPPASKPDLSMWDTHFLDFYLGIFVKLGAMNIGIKPHIMYDNLKKTVNVNISFLFIKAFRLK